MTAAQYRAARKAIGTQEKVAALLDVHPMSISKRESGVIPISREVELAILSLSKKRA